MGVFDSDGLRVEQRGGLLLLTITREARRNALDAATSRAVDAMIERAEQDPDIAVTIITGTGDRAFCSGMDMKEAASMGAGNGLIPGRGFAGITERQRTKPLIAAINGTAVAGGFEIALACDIILAADHVMFGLSEVKRGMFAFAGGIQRLSRQIPRSAAMSIILTGETVSAARLYELGVVSELLPGAELMARAIELGEMIASYSQAAVRNAKLLHDLSSAMPVEHSLSFGMAFGKATLNSADSREGIAAYMEKRDTRYGERDQG